MDELETIWNKYLELFPSNEKTLSILMNSAGLKTAIKILSLAVERGKEIEFVNDETDATGIKIKGEKLDFGEEI